MFIIWGKELRTFRYHVILTASLRRRLSVYGIFTTVIATSASHQTGEAAIVEKIFYLLQDSSYIGKTDKVCTQRSELRWLQKMYCNKCCRTFLWPLQYHQKRSPRYESPVVEICRWFQRVSQLLSISKSGHIPPFPNWFSQAQLKLFRKKSRHTYTRTHISSAPAFK